MRRGTILLGITAALLLVAAPAFAADKDCKDFGSHDAAQAYFKANGGSSTNNVDRLDADHDGVACENHVYRPADKSADGGPEAPTDRSERLPFTGSGDATRSVAAGLLVAGALLVAATRYRPRHAR